jgi:class 3 adenylate cyclase
MALFDELKSGVDDILSTSWSIREGRVVPNSEDVLISGGGVRFEGTVLYADLAQSSKLATDFQQRTAAKIVKAFLLCCTKIIIAHEGKITSFDGDRVMGIFIGDSKNTNAATTALKIKYAVENVIEPKMKAHFSSMKETPYEINHAVGIDTSSILAVRAGQRGSNDLIWVGRSPNFAAKLSTIREPRYNSYITEDVFNVLGESAKKGGEKHEDMWERRNYEWLGEKWVIYRSSWWWGP